jgi:group I intron endonuclease
MKGRMTGIYYIQNMVNGKLYIGSAINIIDRWRLHKGRLRNGNHHNKHLQLSWDNYGENSFIFGVIETIENNEILLEREQYWIDQNGVCDRERGYNAAPVAGGMLGFRHSEETKARLREVGFSKEHIPWNKGKKMEGEYKKNHANAMGERKGLPSGRVGFKHDEETKKKIGELSKGRVCSETTRKKMAVAMTGKKLGESHRVNCLKAWEIRKLKKKEV